MKHCKETVVDKRIIESDVCGHIEIAVIENGVLKYTDHKDEILTEGIGIEFITLFPGTHIGEINSKTIDSLIGFLVSIKCALKE